jgi:hypothetical protein
MGGRSGDRRFGLLRVSLLAFASLALPAHAQLVHFERLSPDLLAVVAPSTRVDGDPGRMQILQAACQSMPAAGLRRRVVDIAIQEWAFFGFKVVDQTEELEDDNDPWPRQRRRRPWLDPVESARVADSIAGYWASTADGAWILERQNGEWNGDEGVAARWRDPWSAAFISWVMCEAGLASEQQFKRAIAHHSYIDQAIRARGSADREPAYVAYDVGETEVEPGDLLCSARRPRYRSISERRPELGSGIRSHCDIAIELDAANARVLVIGGNVRGAVSLKLLAADFAVAGDGRTLRAIGRGRRAVFAHLKLRAPSLEHAALESSPTIQMLRREHGDLDWLQQRLAGEDRGSAVPLTTAVQDDAAGGARQASAAPR